MWRKIGALAWLMTLSLGTGEGHGVWKSFHTQMVVQTTVPDGIFGDNTDEDLFAEDPATELAIPQAKVEAIKSRLDDYLKQLKLKSVLNDAYARLDKEPAAADDDALKTRISEQIDVLIIQIGVDLDGSKNDLDALYEYNQSDRCNCGAVPPAPEVPAEPASESKQDDKSA